MRQFLDQLSDELRESFVGFREPNEHQCIAWPRDDALRVLNQLRGKRLIVAGVDVDEIVDGELQHIGEGSSCEPRKNESFDAYADRSIQAAVDYIASYPIFSDREILFGPVVSDVVHGEPK